MRLMLSGGGAHTEDMHRRFAAMINTGKAVLLVPVASERDAPLYEESRQWLADALAPYGVTRIEVCADLKGVALDDRYAALYIGGGNTYRLLKAVRESGFDRKLRGFLEGGGLVYGSSAGSIIFGRGIGPVTYDDEDDVGLGVSDGLDMVRGFDVCCHYNGEEGIAYKRERILAHGRRTIALPEGCGVLVEDGCVTFIGSGVVVFDGG